MADRRWEEPVVNAPEAAEQNAEWHVLIEETVSWGQGQRWNLSGVHPCANHAEALKQAESAAYRYAPKHPTMRSRREIFQIDDGSWLIRVRGATQSFSYRVSVARYVGTFNSNGNPA